MEDSEKFFLDPALPSEQDNLLHRLELSEELSPSGGSQEGEQTQIAPEIESASYGTRR